MGHIHKKDIRHAPYSWSNLDTFTYFKKAGKEQTLSSFSHCKTKLHLEHSWKALFLHSSWGQHRTEWSTLHGKPATFEAVPLSLCHELRMLFPTELAYRLPFHSTASFTVSLSLLPAGGFIKLHCATLHEIPVIYDRLFPWEREIKSNCKYSACFPVWAPHMDYTSQINGRNPDTH